MSLRKTTFLSFFVKYRFRFIRLHLSWRAYVTVRYLYSLFGHDHYLLIVTVPSDMFFLLYFFWTLSL